MNHPRTRAVLTSAIICAVVLVAAWLVVPRYGHNMTAIRALREMDSLARAIETFRQDTGRLPTQAEGLSVLTMTNEVPGARGPYLTGPLVDRALLNPWGEAYYYTLHSNEAAILSGHPPQMTWKIRRPKS